MIQETLSQAQDASADHLRRAITEIDAAFGDGHAKAHPELVAAMLQASAIEHAVAVGRIASRETNATLLKLKPRLFG
ncbi:MAG: hypothetical protein AAGJ96_02055 [Pseudomonadota bacterium]